MQDQRRRNFAEVEALIRYSTNFMYLREIYNDYDPNEISEHSFTTSTATAHADTFKKITIRRTLVHVAIEANQADMLRELLSNRARLDIPYTVQETEDRDSFTNGGGNEVGFWGATHKPDARNHSVLRNESFTPLEYAQRLGRNNLIPIIQAGLNPGGPR